MHRIEGGYYIKARQIAGSEIASAPPCVREVWDYLLREANHQDRRVNGRVIRRGQLVRTVPEIREALAWRVGFRVERYRMDSCEAAMKWLRRRGMITGAKTGRGIVITVCNYDYYQNPKNYENRNESRNENRSDSEHVPSEKQEFKKLKMEIKKKGTTFPPDADAYRLGELFIHLLDGRGFEWPKNRKPDVQKWATVFDRMIRLDGRTPERIREVLTWVQDDSFWRGVILSPDKLREKWGHLTEKMKNGQKQQCGAEADPGTYLPGSGAGRFGY